MANGVLRLGTVVTGDAENWHAVWVLFDGEDHPSMEYGRYLYPILPNGKVLPISFGHGDSVTDSLHLIVEQLWQMSGKDA